MPQTTRLNHHWIVTEMASHPHARESATLATSVHLICRPRLQGAPVGNWADTLRKLPKNVHDWMVRLQGEDIRGADPVFACVDPSLEIFSRYRAEGRKVNLTKYLEKVWKIAGRTTLEQVCTAESLGHNSLAGTVRGERSPDCFISLDSSERGSTP